MDKDNSQGLIGIIFVCFLTSLVNIFVFQYLSVERLKTEKQQIKLEYDAYQKGVKDSH